jgi:hypothetical protein
MELSLFAVVDRAGHLIEADIPPAIHYCASVA